MSLQPAHDDMQDAIRLLHEELAQTNHDVAALTLELEHNLDALREEIAERKKLEWNYLAQLQRLNLLHQITRAMSERQDLPSIFQVVVRQLEDSLPIHFACVALYDAAGEFLSMENVGLRSAALLSELEGHERPRLMMRDSGLDGIVRSMLTHEPDVSQRPFAFMKLLAKHGLRSLVAVPLIAEGSVFGALIVARHEISSFTIADCEFLQQLSEHVGLASRQTQLYAALERAYEDLRRSQESALQQERLRALGQMASGIAHDINNAISPVTLYTDALLDREPDLSERVRRYLETVKRTMNDVAGTIGRLQKFYRQQDAQTQASPLNLNELVQQVVEFTRARWFDMPQQRGIVISMSTDLDPALPPIMGIDFEIREALTNLIFNAVDALPKGGTIKLRTRLTEVPGQPRTPHAPKWVQLEVSDTGTGMDESTRRRCLEPFFTTKGERGTGLGLAMVYGMIKRHNADIDIDTAIGRGTTFRLSFPVPSLSSAPSASPSARTKSEPLNLLIIDDDPFVLDSLRAVLELDGHSIVAANGGEEGVEAFHAALREGKGFAAVMTDLGMPYMDGNEVARSIKSLAPETPIVLLTGWGRRVPGDNEVSSYVDHVLPKPAKLDEIRETLQQIAANKRTR